MCTFVCTCVCACVCMCVCVHVCAHVCAGVKWKISKRNMYTLYKHNNQHPWKQRRERGSDVLRLPLYGIMHWNIKIQVHKCIHADTNTCAYMYIHTHTHKHAHTHTHTHRHAHTLTHTDMRTHSYTQTCTHMHAHTCTHTHTHSHEPRVPIHWWSSSLSGRAPATHMWSSHHSHSPPLAMNTEHDIS